jgi:hypothetical protein
MASSTAGELCRSGFFRSSKQSSSSRCVRFATTVTDDPATLATGRALPPSRTGLPPAGSRQLRLAHVAVGAGVTSCPPRRSRRAAFPHRAPVEGQTRPAFGAWAAHPVPVRGLGPSGTCGFRRCVRGMRWPSPFLRPAAFPPHSPPPTCRPVLFEASSVLCSRPTPPTFRSGFGSSPSRTDPGPPWRLRAAGGLPGSDTILDGSNWSQTPVERRSLAERSRTCCLRRFAAPRPPR